MSTRLSAGLFFKLPQSSPLGPEHSMTFPVQSSKVVSQPSQTYTVIHHGLVPISVLGKGSTAVIKHHSQKQVGKGKLAASKSILRKARGGTWRQELEQALEHNCLLACSPWLPQFGYHLLKGGTTHNGLYPPISIISKENALQTCLQTNPRRHFLS